MCDYRRSFWRCHRINTPTDTCKMIVMLLRQLLYIVVVVVFVSFITATGSREHCPTKHTQSENRKWVSANGIFGCKENCRNMCANWRSWHLVQPTTEITTRCPAADWPSISGLYMPASGKNTNTRMSINNMLNNVVVGSFLIHIINSLFGRRLFGECWFVFKNSYCLLVSTQSAVSRLSTHKKSRSLA